MKNSRENMLSREEISRHNTKSSCWLVMKDSVYDLTSFLNQHPGGATTILKRAGGQDARHDFEAVGHSIHAKNLLETHRIGAVEADVEEGKESTKIFVEEKKKNKSSGCPFRRRREKEEEEVKHMGDNIWLKENGGRLVGDHGNKLGPGHFTILQFFEFVVPGKMARDDYFPVTGMNEKPYWVSDDPEELNLRDRASRFNLFKEWIFILILMLCGGVVDGDGVWSSTSQVLDFITLIIAGATFMSVFIYSHELATKSFLIFRLLKGGELVTGAISFFTCLASFVWIVKTASWSNFTVLRSAPVFVLSCFLLWPLNMKEKTAKLKNDQDDEDTMATWYRGVETKRMSRGIGVIMAPCVELMLLKRANNGLYGLYDLFALFTFGFSMVSLNFFSGMAVKVAAKTKSVDTSSRDREKAMRCAFSLACGFVAIFIRVVVLVWWYPIEGISMPVSYDDFYTHLKILSTIMICYCLRNEIDAVIISAHIDTLTCRMHLLSVLFAGPIALFVFVYYMILTGLNGIVSWSALTWFVVWYGAFHIYRYGHERSTGSVKRLNSKPAIGKHCRDMCDASLTYKELQAELGMTSLYSLMCQWAANFCMRPAYFFTEVASAILLGNLRYYAHETPVIDFRDVSDNIQMGVAYCVTPSEETQQKPQTFVCNVGHMKGPEKDNSDWIMTNMHTYRMIESLARDSRAGQKGFVSQVIAEFWIKDNVKDENGKDVVKQSIRQVNLSAWNNAKSAHDWYVASRAHRDVVKMLKNGKSGSGALTSFSSLLAHLSPTPGHSLRWFAKCQNCGSLQTKYPDVKECPKCGKGVKIRAYF